jgi:hypothetical protein
MVRNRPAKSASSVGGLEGNPPGLDGRFPADVLNPDYIHFSAQ